MISISQIENLALEIANNSTQEILNRFLDRINKQNKEVSEEIEIIEVSSSDEEKIRELKRKKSTGLAIVCYELGNVDYYFDNKYFGCSRGGYSKETFVKDIQSYKANKSSKIEIAKQKYISLKLERHRFYSRNINDKSVSNSSFNSSIEKLNEKIQEARKEFYFLTGKTYNLSLKNKQDLKYIL